MKKIYSFLLVRIAPWLAMISIAWGRNPWDAPECPIADAEPRAAGFFEVGLVSRQKILGADLGSFGLVETRAAAEIAYFYGSAGPLSLTGIANFWMPIGGELAKLPYQLGQVALLAQGDYRTWFGLTLRGEFQPGLYTDFTEFNNRALAFPVGFHLIQTVSPHLAVQGGVRVYPDFDRLLDPALGLRISAQNVTLDLFYPESGFLWQFDPDWTLLVRLALNRNYDFFIRDHENDDRFLLKESRITLGADFAAADPLLLMFRGGFLLERSMKFENDPIGSRDLDDALFFAVGAGVTF